MKKIMNNKGFTLVELLAVVVVLAIVAAIAMQSITSIIRNNRTDSFISSLNTVDESAALSCAQNENVNDVADYVDQKGIIVSVRGNEITVTPNENGEFKSVTGKQVNARKDKFKGDGTLSCNTDDNVATCTITYTCN